jgi:arginine/serine-rich splicing factor 17
LESIKLLESVREKLDNCHLQLSVFEESVRVKCQRSLFGPTAIEWEQFFSTWTRAKGEPAAGYRPDTLHVRRLPLKWFGGTRPKTSLLVDVFGSFGEIKRFHIPLLDEMDGELNPQKSSITLNGFKKFDFNVGSERFDAFIMYTDHLAFVSAIEQLRGMKLIRTTHLNDTIEESDIEVDFDRTHHLSDRSIRKRQMAKKYGISTWEELQAYKQGMADRKRQLDERVQQLIRRKDEADNCLMYLLRKVGDRQERLDAERQLEMEKQKESRRAQEEQRRIKEQLLMAEEDLRKRLIERKRAREVSTERPKDRLSTDQTPRLKTKHVPSKIVIPSKASRIPDKHI